MEAKDIDEVACAFRDGSYPCGCRDGDKLPDCELCRKIRKAGIHEGVEFVGECCYLWHDEDNNIHICLDVAEWKAKLKKWGIE